MKLLSSTIAYAGLISLFVFSCKEKSSTERKFIAIENMDTTVKPGDNFYKYVNGNWMKNAVIPSTESGIGVFLDLYNNAQANQKAILEDLAKSSSATGSLEQKVGDLYTSGMDSTTIDSRGYDPVKPELQKINTLTDVKSMMQFIAEENRVGNPMLFRQAIGADQKNSSINRAGYYQGGLGLPDRDYYFKTDSANQKVVNAYKAYIQKLFTLTGDDPSTAARKMQMIYDLEKQMAGSHRTNVELRNPQINYNLTSVSELDKNMPATDWKDLLSTLGVKSDSVDIGQPGFYTKLNELFTIVKMDTWKAYLSFHTLSNASKSLSNEFVKANFDYVNKALYGQQEMKPRWKRMVAVTDANLGEAFGQLYVKKYFTGDAKKRMLELVNNLQKAFDIRISKLDWMSDNTKAVAKEKLYAFLKKIGYPDKWRDYSKVVIDKNKYFENVRSARKNQYEFDLNKLGKPVDRMEWGMTPPTINAYYNPSFNEIVFPAGILQFPFFDLSADDAINYGGIGMAIGHEMTHGFDDQGAQYDKNGNLKNWWSKEDSIKFKHLTKTVVDQFNSFTILDTVHINGELTQGENIADLGGINIAYDAFKMTKEGQGNDKIDGFTPDQRFFISFAQSWRDKIKDESLRSQINTDPHSPAVYRVNAPLMNFTPFYKAFDVKEGDKMYKADSLRIKIW